MRVRKAGFTFPVHPAAIWGQQSCVLVDPAECAVFRLYRVATAHAPRVDFRAQMQQCITGESVSPVTAGTYRILDGPIAILISYHRLCCLATSRRLLSINFLIVRWTKPI